MSITEIADTVQDQVIEAVKSAQSAVLDAVRTWADSLENLIPEERRTALAGRRAAVAERLPDPADVVDRAFGFAERLLETQHEFVSKLVEATALGRAGQPAKPAKASPKAAATKAESPAA